VAVALESLSVLAGGSPDVFCAETRPIRYAPHETCYDHHRGHAGRSRCMTASRHWAGSQAASGADNPYDLTPRGVKAFEALGIDIEANSENCDVRFRPTPAWTGVSDDRMSVGAVGAAVLNVALQQKWVIRDSR